LYFFFASESFFADRYFVEKKKQTEISGKRSKEIEKLEMGISDFFGILFWVFLDESSESLPVENSLERVGDFGSFAIKWLCNERKNWRLAALITSGMIACGKFNEKDDWRRLAVRFFPSLFQIFNENTSDDIRLCISQVSTEMIFFRDH
jgi:hypothetical protein